MMLVYILLSFTHIDPLRSATASLSGDLTRLVVNDSVGGFALYDITNGESVNRYDSDQAGAKAVALAATFIHNDKALITGTVDGTVRLWDVEDAYIFSTLEHGRRGE
jgi:WD40 repeat protein